MSAILDGELNDFYLRATLFSQQTGEHATSAIKKVCEGTHLFVYCKKLRSNKILLAVYGRRPGKQLREMIATILTKEVWVNPQVVRSLRERAMSEHVGIIG